MTRKTFYCYTHDRDEPRSIYGGEVGGYSHCLEAIAGARTEKERKITARVTNTSARVKVEEKLYQRELERLSAGEYDYA